MFSDLTTAQRNQHIEVCRYFVRAKVMRDHLKALVNEHDSLDEAITAEWDKFWAYYCFWASGLWVACEGMERIGFGDEAAIAEVKRGMALLHPVRQATFHYKPNTTQMNRHFDTANVFAEVWSLHENIADIIGEFLISLPEEYMESLDK